MEFLRRTTWMEKTVFVLALAVFCAAVTGVIFFNRIFAKPFIDPKDIIAKVIQVSNSVKRHTPFQFEFVEIEREDPVGNGDTIFSGQRSAASIVFNEGSVLNIGAESLVVIRVRDGKLEVKIEKGTVSGKLKDDTQMEIQSDEESVTMTGKNGTEFELSYLPMIGIDIKKYVKTDPERHEASELPEGPGPKDEKKSGEPPPPSTRPDAIPAGSKQIVTEMKVKGFKIDDGIKMMPKKFSLKAPWPVQNAVVLHKNDFQLSILPKAACEQSCNLDIYLEGQKYYSKDFGPHKVPMVYMKIAKTAQGKIRWILRDGDIESKGDFELMPYSESNFAAALKDKRSIEVAD